MCVVAFVCDRSTLEKKKSKGKSKQKQDNITIITVIKTHQNLPPTKTTTKSRSSREPEFFFFEKLKTRNLVFFPRQKKKLRKKVPGILEMSWDFHEISLATMMEFKPALDILAPRATIYSPGLDSDHILPRVGGANPSYTATICSAKLESLSNPPG